MVFTPNIRIHFLNFFRQMLKSSLFIFYFLTPKFFPPNVWISFLHFFIVKNFLPYNIQIFSFNFVFLTPLYLLPSNIQFITSFFCLLTPIYLFHFFPPNTKIFPSSPFLQSTQFSSNFFANLTQFLFLHQRRGHSKTTNQKTGQRSSGAEKIWL